MSERISRRRFLAATVAAGAVADPSLACFRRRLACPAPLPCPPVWPPPPGPDAGLRVRPNITALTDAQLASLRRGVAAMKKLPATDRRSWAFQAAIHGTNDPTATNPLFNQCQHGTLQFLPWHRAYLYFFERILRWAAGDPALTLPYWDWTAQPVLPQPFRAPADAAANALFEPNRKANDASALPPQVVSTDLDTALAQVVFPAAPGVGFSPDLEGSPHGAVHVLVGGLGGLMSSVPTAAGDPIFWLHHCNIDRLWNVWLNRGGGRASPADAAFLDKPYTFADETGGTATVKVRDIIRSADLGYRYDGVPNPTVAFALTAQPVAGATAPPVAASSAPPDELALPLAKVEAKPLGFKEERVKLTTVKEQRAALATPLPARPADAPGGPRVTVAVEGLAADAAPDFVYAVYVNLPAGEQPEEVRRRHYVGSINFFGKTRADMKGGHAHGAGDGFAATFDATAAVAGLQRAKGFDPDALTVTLLPLAAAPPGLGAAEVKARGEAVAKKAQVTYKRVTVRMTPAEK